MINYLVCALGVWMLMGVLFAVYEDASQTWLIRLSKCLICLPWNIIYHFLLYIIFLPTAIVWKFFRNAVRGVSVECWEKFSSNIRYWKLGCLRLCHDKTARAISNKWFLVRIVKPAEEIKHLPKKS